MDRRSSQASPASPGRADPTGFQLPGDGNQDSRLDLSDALFLLAHLFGFSTTPLPCDGGSLSAGGNLVFFNLNGDSFVDISDVAFLLGYLFLDGAPPVPGTACVPITGCLEGCTP